MGPRSVFLGQGSWAIFSFSLPHAGRLHFQRLVLSVDAGGAEGARIGRVYDWRARHWVGVNLHYGDRVLSGPDRFVSPQGIILVRLQASYRSGDIKIYDPEQAIQLSGKGVVG